jgi:ABC-type nitrate/sulfonate/bicarbonate transport system permease component
MKAVRRIGYAVALPVVILAVWWFASAGSTSFFFPPLSDILSAARETWLGDRLGADVVPSLVRLAVGYLVAAIVAVTLGIVIGTHRWLRDMVEPALEFVRAIPPPVLVPVLVLLLGIGDTMKVVVIAVGCLWPILLNTVEGVRAVDEVQTDTARMFKLPARTRLTTLVLPSASPQIFTGLRQSLSVAIILMVISELFAASNGLGFAIVQAQRTFAIPQMWAGMLVLGILGLILSLLFGFVERRVLGWYHGLRQSQRL